MKPYFPGGGWICANGKQWMSSLFCFTCKCDFCFSLTFALLWLLLVFISTQEFSRFCLSDSLSHLTTGEWENDSVALSYCLGLNHNSLFLVPSMGLQGLRYREIWTEQAKTNSFLCLFSDCCYITPCLLHMFPVVLFITSGGCIKVIILTYCVTLVYDMVKFLVETNLVFVLSIAIIPVLWGPSLGSY